MRSDFHGEEVDGGNSSTFPPRFDSLKKNKKLQQQQRHAKRLESGSVIKAAPDDGMSVG